MVVQIRRYLQVAKISLKLKPKVPFDLGEEQMDQGRLMWSGELSMQRYRGENRRKERLQKTEAMPFVGKVTFQQFIPILFVPITCHVNSSGPGLWLFLFNVWLVYNKTCINHNLIVDKKSNLVCIVEMWLSEWGRCTFFGDVPK